MYALLTNNNEITQVGELQTLFPNEFQPTHLYAIQHGAKPIVDGNKQDERFYWVTFDKYEVGSESVTREYVNTPKALEDVTVTPEGATEPVTTFGLKSNYITQFKHTANSMLASTDWMAIRKFERSIDIPADVVTKRAAILTECDRLIAAVTAATNMPDFITAVASAEWPK
jgi:hypothetical protein